MVWQSIVFMFWLSMGTLQVIASYARLNGLSFFRYHLTGYIFGTANIVASFYWFFKTVELTEGGPKGFHDDQFLSFFLGIGSAILLTSILSSLIKFRLNKRCQRLVGSNDINSSGIEVFTEKTLLQVLNHHHNSSKGNRNAS